MTVIEIRISLFNMEVTEETVILVSEKQQQSLLRQKSIMNPVTWE